MWKKKRRAGNVCLERSSSERSVEVLGAVQDEMTGMFGRGVRKIRAECFPLPAVGARTDPSREIWLRSLSEACALLMIRRSALIYSAIVFIGVTHLPKLCIRVGTCRSVCFVLRCVSPVDGLQYIRRSWLGRTFSLPSILPDVHGEPGVDAHLRRFTPDFLHFGRVCHVAGSSPLA